MKIKQNKKDVILGCVDWRLKRRDTIEQIQEIIPAVNNATDVFYWPGGPHDFVNGPYERQEFMLERLSLVVNGSDVDNFVLWQHALCKLYLLLYSTLSPKKIAQKQIEDSRKLKKIFNERHPNTIVTLLQAKKGLGQRFEFELVK